MVESKARPLRLFYDKKRKIYYVILNRKRVEVDPTKIDLKKAMVRVKSPERKKPRGARRRAVIYTRGVPSTRIQPVPFPRGRMRRYGTRIKNIVNSTDISDREKVAEANKIFREARQDTKREEDVQQLNNFMKYMMAQAILEGKKPIKIEDLKEEEEKKKFEALPNELKNLVELPPEPTAKDYLVGRKHIEEVDRLMKRFRDVTPPRVKKLPIAKIEKEGKNIYSVIKKKLNDLEEAKREEQKQTISILEFREKYARISRQIQSSLTSFSRNAVSRGVREETRLLNADKLADAKRLEDRIKKIPPEPEPDKIGNYNRRLDKLADELEEIKGRKVGFEEQERKRKLPRRQPAEEEEQAPAPAPALAPAPRVEEEPEEEEKAPAGVQEEIERELAEEEEQVGDGRDVLKALYTSDIDKVLGRFDEFIGTFPRDKIELEKNMVPQGFVYNTDPASKGGEHWCAVYISPTSIEFYDPLGNPPDSDVVQRVINQVKTKMELPWLLKVKMNNVKNQDDSTETCGYHCIEFLTARMSGKPFVTATKFDNSKNAEKMLFDLYA